MDQLRAAGQNNNRYMRGKDRNGVCRMKWVKQFLLIILMSFLGETLRHLLPFTVPAGIYGLLILFGLLLSGLVRLPRIEEAADFVIQIKPLFFIPAGVGLMTQWAEMKTMLIPFILSVIVATALVMGVTGLVTQFFIHHGKGGWENE